jgi:glycyl-tRNA synthetase
LHSFTETEGKDYFKFDKSVAPVQVGMFPLVNKEGPREIAQELTETLRMNGFTVEYDATGTIGKRYARADEIGIPLAVTVDFDSLEDKKVTVRDRDTEAQERIPIDELNDYLEKYYK